MNDWINWGGGDCPVPKGATEVEIRYRDDDADGIAEERMTGDHARKLSWVHAGGLGDILAYRLLQTESQTTKAKAVILPAYPAERKGLPITSGSKPTNPKDAIGVKKAKFSVIPAGVMFDVGLAMLEGACKYGRHNYRSAGVRSSVYYDAAMGHLADWWEGQDIDAESNLSHVTKAIASLVVLRDAMLQNMLTDDRPPRSKVSKADFNDRAAEIIERHADKNPTHFTLGNTP